MSTTASGFRARHAECNGGHDRHGSRAGDHGDRGVAGGASRVHDVPARHRLTRTLGGRMFLQRFMRRARRAMMARCMPAVALAIGLALALAAVPARAQPTDLYPAKPIVYVVTFAAGGGTDIMARTIAKGMEP